MYKGNAKYPLPWYNKDVQAAKDREDKIKACGS